MLRYKVRCGLCARTIGRTFFVRRADGLYDRHLDECPHFRGEVRQMERWLP